MTNIYNLFKFLEDKKGKEIPFKAKLLYAPETLTDEDLKVGKSLRLDNRNIISLPDNLHVEGSLDLYNNNNLTSLPDNLTVRSACFVSKTNLSSIPNNLKIGGAFTIYDTPLSEKYDEDEIRKMIEVKGGYVGGYIYI